VAVTVSELGVRDRLSLPTKSISVLVVAEQELVLCGMRLMLGQQEWVSRCLGARDIERAAPLAEAYAPDVVLVDLKLQGGVAEVACARLRAAAPGTRVLLMTSADELPSRTVAGVGACGYLSKGWPARDIVQAVRASGLGLPIPVAERRRHDGLSARQREILQLLADGGTNHEIARVLHLSLNTVKQHTSAVYRKLGVRNRAEAIGRAQAMGLLA
jgi:two-component system response regulator DesR